MSNRVDCYSNANCRIEECSKTKSCPSDLEPSFVNPTEVGHSNVLYQPSIGSSEEKETTCTGFDKTMHETRSSVKTFPDPINECSSSITKPKNHRRHRRKPAQALPIGSVAQIIGNDRIDPRLVNQRGTVLRITALGGWHELELENGDIRKVQRNGLKLVISHNSAKQDSSARHPIVSKFSDISLRKYARFHSECISTNVPCRDLESAVARHFTNFVVHEEEVIRDFTKYLKKLNERNS